MKYIFYAMFLISFTNLHADKPSAITFKGGGRLGDKLLIYCKAKWFSYKYNIPLQCPRFPFMDKLMLAEKENLLVKTVRKGFKHKKTVKREKDINSLTSDTLFMVDFNVASDEFSNINIKKIFNEHPSFLNELRSLIAPREALAKFVLPKDKLAVAVHVRRGSGSDKPLFHKEAAQRRIAYPDKNWPTKFPPDEFYIEQIRRLDTMLASKPMYVHIFTDYQYPEQIIAKYKEALGLPNISFGCQQENNHENAVLDDLFAMTQFEYLIHSSSNFSKVAYIIGDHKYAIRPIHGTWHGDLLTIDEIVISCRNEDGTISLDRVRT